MMHGTINIKKSYDNISLISSLNWKFCRHKLDRKSKPMFYVQKLFYEICAVYEIMCRSQWPRGLSGSSATTRLLRSWVWITSGAWMFVCCEFCLLSGRGLCDELITHPEESYQQWCVVVCDLENPHEWGGHSPHWAAAPQGNKNEVM